MGAGRPLKFKSVKELEEKINDYFIMCDDENRPYTITGLALALDTDRKTLINYEAKEEYFNTIKKAKLKVENYAEEKLFKGGNSVGIIFNLKNNYGWKDQQEIKATNEVNISPLESAMEKLIESKND